MVKPGGQNHHHSSQFAQCPTLNKPPEMLDSDSDLAFIFTICKSYTDQITNSWKRIGIYLNIIGEKQIMYN